MNWEKRVHFLRSTTQHKYCRFLNTYTAKPVCWNGWISDSYCSLKPFCSGMGEVVPARTSPTLLPHPLALCCHYPVSKCRSASTAVTGTVRVNFHEPFIAWVLRASLEPRKKKLPIITNIMFSYENGMPDVTFMKLNICEHQMYPNQELKGSRKLRNLQQLFPASEAPMYIMVD